MDRVWVNAFVCLLLEHFLSKIKEAVSSSKEVFHDTPPPQSLWQITMGVLKPAFAAV